MEVGKVTSTTTKQSTASAFAGHPPYYMVVRTREGLPVKSISNFSGEDEVILPMGHCRDAAKNMSTDPCRMEHHGWWPLGRKACGATIRNAFCVVRGRLGT
jgi:hypothetical protein